MTLNFTSSPLPQCLPHCRMGVGGLFPEGEVTGLMLCFLIHWLSPGQTPTVQGPRFQVLRSRSRKDGQVSCIGRASSSAV